MSICGQENKTRCHKAWEIPKAPACQQTWGVALGFVTRLLPMAVAASCFSPEVQASAPSHPSREAELGRTAVGSGLGPRGWTMLSSCWLLK